MMSVGLTALPVAVKSKSFGSRFSRAELQTVEATEAQTI